MSNWSINLAKMWFPPLIVFVKVNVINIFKLQLFHGLYVIVLWSETKFHNRSNIFVGITALLS